MLEAIKEKLRAAGLTVYDFAEKIGTCKGMYGRHTYEVACLTPYTDVDGLAALERRVRQAMQALPGLRLSSSGGTGVEQTYQARAMSLAYVSTERLY